MTAPRGGLTLANSPCMNPARLLVPLLFIGACTAEVPANLDPDLDNDTELQAMADDPMPEVDAVDADTVEPMIEARVACSKQRFLHVANFSYVAKLSECVNGVCPNGCWGVQERTSGFTCNYDGGQA